jgi:hypothetical protein
MWLAAKERKTPRLALLARDGDAHPATPSGTQRARRIARRGVELLEMITNHASTMKGEIPGIEPVDESETRQKGPFVTAKRDMAAP